MKNLVLAVLIIASFTQTWGQSKTNYETKTIKFNTDNSKTIGVVNTLNAQKWEVQRISHETGQQTIQSEEVDITIFWYNNFLEMYRDRYFDFTAKTTVKETGDKTTIITVYEHPEISKIEINMDKSDAVTKVVFSK